MSKPSCVRVHAPLAPHADGFREELAHQGYTPHSASYHLQLMAHVSRWLVAKSLDANTLSDARVEDFLAHRRAQGYTQWLSPRATAPLLAYLRQIGVTPDALPAQASTPADVLFEHYDAYLVAERGLSKATIDSYLHVARLFLKRLPDTQLDLAGIRAAQVTKFVLAECAARSVGSSKYIVCGLRALLRFLYSSGRIDAALDAAVPTVAGWRLSELPKALSSANVDALLASCDRRTNAGRRDFAVLNVLVRLGLRAGEVAALQLDDIDWSSGEVVVRGKAQRVELLPLPVDVGEAIVGWLRRGRPRTECRQVFIRVRAAHTALAAGGVSAIVRAACKRAGLVEAGAHRLRHTAATEMLHAGASLSEVGQVLRHTSALTTAIYAKVDRDRLRDVTRPWPGEVS